MAPLMKSADRDFDMLAQDLVADLKPVKRLPPPWRRACVWLALVVVVAAVLATRADVSAVARRLTGAPDLWLAVASSSLTAVLATIATFQLALPDRSPGWALLPLPSVITWIAASGLGCARTWLVPGAQPTSMTESGHCLMFVVFTSIPFSVALFAMLRRSYSLYPTLTGAMAGLAAAAVSATLLNFFHPFDATVSDLAVHAIAVGLVVAIGRTAGRPLLHHP